MFVGGILLKKKARAIKQGVRAAAAAGGLQGCLHNLRLDGRLIGLPEVLETYEVRAGCGWEFPCAAAVSPCGAGETCSQEGMAGHSCSCAQPPCGDDASPSPPGGESRAHSIIRPDCRTAGGVKVSLNFEQI